jgi:hypothetical protein
MSELAEAVEKELVSRQDEDTLALWLQIWKLYEHQGSEGLSRYLHRLLVSAEEEE